MGQKKISNLHIVTDIKIVSTLLNYNQSVGWVTSRSLKTELTSKDTKSSSRDDVKVKPITMPGKG